MASAPVTEKDSSPLWQFVSLADYSLPVAPVTEAVKTGLTIFRHKFGSKETESDSPLKTKDELQLLPSWQLERVAPACDWRGAAEALSIKLEDWLRQAKPNPPFIVLVAPPHSGHTDILTAWVAQHAWRVLSSPSPEQVLAGDDIWLSNQRGDGSPWVFPALERAYLRHATGLGLICRFLDQVYAGHLGRGIIGCDSWAFAFLRHVWHGRMPITLTLQAFDQSRITSYIQGLAAPPCGKQILFRHSNSGKYVLPPPERDEVSPEVSQFLQVLTAHSRGIFGVAWAGWRAGLRTEPDEMRTEQIDTENTNTPHQTVWVAPWDPLNQPMLPTGAGHDEAFVLHTLLLHNGLPLVLLNQLLPLTPSQTIETLFRLEEAGLVAQRNTVWLVSPEGYPAVRQFLQTQGYLIDPF